MQTTELAAIASRLAARRDDIVEKWHAAVMSDPQYASGTSVPRAQLHDHIPALLEDFEKRLSESEADDAATDHESRGDAAAHGLHRWQQGFALTEVTRELGCLNECVVAVLEELSLEQPPFSSEAMALARKTWASLHSVTISGSTAEYFRLRQLEAAGHVTDLERALQSLKSLEQQRADLWQEAAHDLRGNLGVVANATAGLGSVNASPEARSSFLRLLDRNVRAIRRLLEDVTSLARLQGGKEHRLPTPMDAAVVLREVCESLVPAAQERNLFLRCEGPEALPVEGDAIKVRRIAQNLVLNAIKYTREGGVTVTFGAGNPDDLERWFLEVQDTGPGFHAGPGSPLVGALAEATDQAKSVAADAASGQVTHIDPEASKDQQSGHDSRAVRQLSGEGIGLSIVKRLCDLLDASVELDTTASRGTMFRILLPRRYES